MPTLSAASHNAPMPLPVHLRPSNRPPHWLTALVLLGSAGLHSLTALAADPTPLPPNQLPPVVQTALARAGLPATALHWVVADTRPEGPVWVRQQADTPVNPASTMKLVTTFAALDMLGPAYTWRTQVYTDGPVQAGVLRGSLYIQGGGDPKLVTERLWLLARRIQALGIQRIEGDLVLDRSAFDLPPHDPSQFDGEPLRPYNASPDALLINYKAQVWTFVPDTAAGVARISVEPPLAGVETPSNIPLTNEACGDWRGGLKAQWADPLHPQFKGGYPAACGERTWPVAHPDPDRYAARAVAGMWSTVGGQLTGVVRDGAVPPQATWRFAVESPPLAEVVRDVNKYSNNVMAQHLLLALGQQNGGTPSRFDSSRSVLETWWRQRMGTDQPVPMVDNGAGLSRQARVTPMALVRLLQVAYASGLMPDLMASLPLSGQDGTLRRMRHATGLAHLKTGSLSDVMALAGYVHGADGRRRVLVAIINHPNARSARPVMDSLVQWAGSW